MEPLTGTGPDFRRPVATTGSASRRTLNGVYRENAAAAATSAASPKREVATHPKRLRIEPHDGEGHSR
ncbi:hypothetical protein [Natrialba sp. INN-245]|uniref:hypothetical protein n=1 Tax=Natrialba sp. INN-245 TaxID=2690967 RepID=UPI001311580B|nr:hypothetical protein [Natrialba sp. INN-245]MWV41206.1 hypothetical protein [Natrialba sp. INN-245]